MDNGGREALLYYLENYDLSGVSLRVVPKTKALFDMKLHSMSAIQKFWYGRLQAGTVRNLDSEWNSEISVRELKDEYKVFLKDLSVNPRFSDEEFGKQLHKLIPKLIKIRPTIDNIRVYQYQIPSLKECRDYFQKIMHTDITWESVDYPDETAF